MEMNSCIWDDNIKMEIKDTSFIFALIFHWKTGKAQFLEKLMKPFCIKQ